jgi:hypothetical protein
VNYLPRLALNRDLPDLCLLSSSGLSHWCLASLSNNSLEHGLSGVTRVKFTGTSELSHGYCITSRTSERYYPKTPRAPQRYLADCGEKW